MKCSMLEAVNKALDHALSENDSVIMLGEDIGYSGGVFKTTKGLQERYGANRVIDAPLAEGMIAGVAIGMASQGMVPVAEIQFSGFIFPAMEQIICHAARMRNRTRGRITLPITIRTPCFGGIHSPEHHSESVEAFFSHVPGLRVVIPSTAERAYRLLLGAIRSKDPVIFCEPTRLYHSSKQDFELDGIHLDIGKAIIETQGNDLTVISYGAITSDVRKAISELHEVSIEFIDMVTTNPIDAETIINSVNKTGKCLIVSEAPRACSVSSEVAAIIADECILKLRAPIKRVTGWDTTIPYAKNENNYIPSVDRIKSGITELISFDF